MAWADKHGSQPDATAKHPWDIAGGLGRYVPPTSYGPLVYFVMSSSNLIFGTTGSFFALVAVFAAEIAVLCSLAIDQRKWSLPGCVCCLFIFVQFYPIHFELDRGNSEIILAIVFAWACIVMLCANAAANKRDKGYLIDGILILAMLGKPVWFTLIPFFFVFRSPLRALLNVAIIGASYQIGFFAYHATWFDLLAATKKIFSIVAVNNSSYGFNCDLTTIVKGIAWVFTPRNANGHLTDALVADIGLNSIKYISTVGVIFILLISLSVRLRLKSLREVRAAQILLLMFLITATILFTVPSGDYRLIDLLPLTIGLLSVSLSDVMGEYRRFIVLLSVPTAVIYSMSNYFIQDNGFNHHGFNSPKLASA
jgi:hypothetical protein